MHRTSGCAQTHDLALWITSDPGEGCLSPLTRDKDGPPSQGRPHRFHGTVRAWSRAAGSLPVHSAVRVVHSGLKPLVCDTVAVHSTRQVWLAAREYQRTRPPGREDGPPASAARFFPEG